ncbi:hypothetical protein L0P54_10115 [Anaerosalibacter bizertensis]|uniref:Uncharacterized protein n=2 Tax=Bacillota TaxID=1239 RepID=A0A9Q4ACP2_9FIRM|nr:MULTISPECIES: hypothetical protein [Bacillota]MBV1821457.1 hypothetical protein [Bacteroidales bacterium MSK.15.36]MCG4564932.1 hypothetical protein [Anaerosalibacter bizertensis]MCG4581110.1 hypothetical protein [Clostridium cochlearium]MCG4583344.1 hypothetical protein [Anaerosalibacter bizertensis]
MGEIQMDFVKDWQEEILKDIKKEGIQIPNDIRTDSLIIKYFTYLRKKGTGQPYHIHKSKEFKCPSELKYGLNQIIYILEYGGDISPYLSKQVDELENDGMFNDWGVLHFHLGKEMEKNNKYVKRTGPLLFVYFKENNAYLINIYKHGDWTKKEVLQIMYDNWPELIEPFIMKEVQGLSTSFTEKEHQELRKSGVATIMELKNRKGNNVVIMPPGLGITTSRDALIDVRNYDYEVDKIHSLEDLIKREISLIKDLMQKESIEIPEKFIFCLARNQGKWYIKEKNTNLILEYY